MTKHRERSEDEVIAESEAVLASLRRLAEQLENYTADLRAESRRRSGEGREPWPTTN